MVYSSAFNITSSSHVKSAHLSQYFISAARVNYTPLPSGHIVLWQLPFESHLKSLIWYLPMAEMHFSLFVSPYSRINFVLQIGSTSDDPQCHINTGGSDIAMKSVVLQYTNNNGIDWHLLQTHDPRQFGRAMRLSLPLPEGARRHAVRFRWWQPVHDGPNEDQWAIDHIHLDT